MKFKDLDEQARNKVLDTHLNMNICDDDYVGDFRGLSPREQFSYWLDSLYQFDSDGFMIDTADLAQPTKTKEIIMTAHVRMTVGEDFDRYGHQVDIYVNESDQGCDDYTVTDLPKPKALEVINNLLEAINNDNQDELDTQAYDAQMFLNKQADLQ